jgi:hypothetical protein
VNLYRSSAVVAPDETGWRICGRKRWLWVFVGENATVYLIAEGRGYEHAAGILGENFSGVLERDGWAPYRRFTQARHQTCLAHLLRRANELIAESRAGQARVPHQVKALLLDALALREARREHDDVIEGHAVEIQAAPGPDVNAAGAAGSDRLALPAARVLKALLAGVAPIAQRALGTVHAAVDGASTAAASPESIDLHDARAQLDTRLRRLLAGHPTHPPNRRLLAHLTNEQDHLFTFLDTPGVQATNWRAEQAIRPAVVNRKNWGGNRTRHGADTQQILMSVIRTAPQQNTDPVALLADLQRQPAPTVTPALSLPTHATSVGQTAATRGP